MPEQPHSVRHLAHVNLVGSTIKLLRLSALSFVPLVLIGATAQAADSTSAAMYFHSQVQDASGCDLIISQDRSLGFPEFISNPAATCPDTFAWKQLLDAVESQFWTNWANDETLYVSNPKPVCKSETATDCCFVNREWQYGAKPQVGYRDASGYVAHPSDIGGPGKLCPYIPGDWGGAAETTFVGGKTVTSHNTTFLKTLDPGRVSRQREVEIVYRNDSFMRYSTEEELYSQAGLEQLFKRVSGEAANSIPHRPTGQGVAYPADAVMFKVDWIPEATMIELGYVKDHDDDLETPPQNPNFPFVTMKINANVVSGSSKLEEGIYYLAAITGASKALPNWHWYAFEHALNPGRCDFTGCNDSFGYLHNVEVVSPLNSKEKLLFKSNFIAPHVIDDQLADGTSIFNLAKVYPSGELQPSLSKAYESLGIGCAAQPVDPNLPQITDPAWKSYRLKGTQTQFYNRDGYPTIVGASITEAGFVNTSSCMSCHVQASVDANTRPGVPSVGASGRLNLLGIGEVVNGAPYTGDYYDRGTANQRAVQTDFVWGASLFAQ